MPIRPVRAAVAAALVLIGLAAVAAPAGADPHDDQARVDRELAGTRAALEVADGRVKAAALAYQQADKLLPEAKRVLADAQGVRAGAEAHAMATDRAAKAAAAEAERAGVAFDQAWAAVDKAREQIGTFAAEAYKGRRIATVSVLLTADSPSDFAVGLGYLQRMAEEQRSGLARVTAARLTAKEHQNATVIAQRRADTANREAQRALAEAADAEAAATDAAARVQTLIDQREAALKVAEHGRAETLQRYQELRRESARIAALIRSLAARKPSTPGGAAPALRPGARLPMPVAGWKSSEFGMRYDPYYHVWQLHAGVDLAAPGGTPIYAVAAGRVFTAGWNGGYGLYTCIYHGLYRQQGFATCYAHQSTLLVSEGQQVRRGQLIGRVGTTGASTGDHLHFEVRLDGEPVDPEPWLPACLC